MISYTKLVLSLLLGAASFTMLGWVLIAEENCYGAALATGQCSRVPYYIVEGVGYAGFYAGFYVIFYGVRQRWKTLQTKWIFTVHTGLGVVVGGLVAEAMYYIARGVGVIVADVPLCGGYDGVPPGCFVYNQGVEFWFVATGCFTGCAAFAILAMRRQERKGGTG